MRRRAAFVVWVGLGLCGSGWSSSACSSMSCTEIGCVDSEQLTFSVTVEQAADAQLTACRQGRCWHGQLSTATFNYSTNDSELLLAPDDASNNLVLCTIDTHSQSGQALFEITWDASADAGDKVGDTLSASLDDSAGNTLVQRSGTVASIREYFPNGADCDRYGCQIAVVKASSD